MSLLNIQDLCLNFPAPGGSAAILRGINFSLESGQSLGIVGESGCGKSMLSYAIMGLAPGGARLSGKILLEDEDLLKYPEEKLCTVRGRQIGMVFQEPMTALNPVATIGDQVMEGPRLHLGMNLIQARGRAEEVLQKVGLPRKDFPLNLYPHQLSGGQRQRVAIAIALACEPKILIADEPTTALDVTSQAQILDLLRDLADELGMSLLMISHDLGVIARTCDTLMVVYAGQVIEQGRFDDIYRAPLHPYTEGLFSALPHNQIKRLASGEAGDGRLQTIPGVVPPPTTNYRGCTFAPRCFKAEALCHEVSPSVFRDEVDGRKALCHFPISVNADASNMRKV